MKKEPEKEKEKLYVVIQNGFDTMTEEQKEKIRKQFPGHTLISPEAYLLIKQKLSEN
jgi:hypothetical protein